MNTLFATPIDPHIDPKAVVENALAWTLELKEKLELPITKFIEAPARLKRKGVTFLVTAEIEGKEEDVPIRVENTKVVYTRFCSSENLASWRNRVIHSITVHVRDTMGDIIKKISQFIKISLHRFKRRLEKKVFADRVKSLSRSERRNYYRQCPERVSCH